MRIEQICLREIAIPLKTPFRTSQGTESLRHLLLIEARMGEHVGYGEVSALSTPFYTEETYQTARVVLSSFLIPIALQTDWATPRELAEALAVVKRHYMAKAGLEAAAWDLYARIRGVSLAEALGGTQSHIASGLSLGIERDLDKQCRTVEELLREGYRRVKLKIEPDWDFQPLHRLRRTFPEVLLQADANGSYTPEQTGQLLRLDELDLLMIEQPFPADDLLNHARLQEQMRTPICLDESIETLHDAYQALQLGSCRIINIKPGRVGGASQALSIHDLCRAQGVPLWCGGMLESGIGRAHAIALASLPGFTLPADLSASSRYWQEDIIDPPVEVTDGLIEVSTEVGLGYSVRQDLLAKYTRWTETYK